MLLSPPHPLLLIVLTAALLCPTASGDRLGPAVTRLGLQLAAQLEKTAAGAASVGRLENFVLSPYSAHAALSQLALGARGVTAAQLEQLLGRPAVDSSHLHANFTAGLLRSGGRRQLRIANLMALSQGFEPRPSYTAQLCTRFQAEVQQFDFAGNLTASVREMNRYVRRATEGRIPVLLSPQSLGSNTLMVLLNAVYFKALWQHRFDPRNNFIDTFERSDGRKVRTTFMSGTMTVRVRRDRLRRVTMLELPYDSDDGATSLLVILPFKNRDDGEELEYRDAGGGVGGGNYQDFNNMIMQRLAKFRLEKRGHKVRVLVQLPRFRIRHRTNLKPVLQSLGVTAVFSPRSADLAGIAAVRPPLFVSEALQQVVLDVDEEGTEAAAATAVIKSARSGPFWFTADRPFVFAVYDYRLGAPLFLGKVEDPTL
jgi:serine protease inhibitor